MTQIKQIAIRNFQSLRKVKLDLGRVTVVTGHSDAGKSALIRALESASFNMSVGEFLTEYQEGGITRTADKMAVALSTDDGSLIWERGKTSPQYTLLKGNEKKYFTKLGRSGVPDEVKAFLGMWDYQIEGKSFYRIQFGNQFDPTFLVIGGGVTGARVLGALTGLHIFTNASKRLKVEKDQKRNQLEQLKQQQQTLQMQLFPLINLEKQLQQLQGIEKQVEVLRVRQQCLAKLRQIQESVKILQYWQSQTKLPLNWEFMIFGWEERLKGIKIRLRRLESFHQIYEQTNYRRTLIKQLSSVTPVPDLKDLGPRIRRLDSLRTLRQAYKHHKENHDALAVHAKKTKSDLHETLNDLDRWEHFHPICGTCKGLGRLEKRA